MMVVDPRILRRDGVLLVLFVSASVYNAHAVCNSRAASQFNGASWMKIKIMAGRLVLPQWTNYSDFFTYAKSFDGDALNANATRRIHFRLQRDLTLGLNIYIKDQRAYYEYIEAGRGRPAAARLSTMRNMMEFNYFFFRNDTGAFAITQHAGCCTGMADFERIILKLFRDFQRASKLAHKEKGGDPRDLNGKAEMKRLSSRESWEDHINRASHIDELSLSNEYESGADSGALVETVGATPTLLGMGPTIIKSTYAIVRFVRTATKRDVLSFIKKAHQAARPKRATVTGDNGEINVRIGQNAQIFDRVDFNEYVEELDLQNFHESKLMAAILEYRNETIMRAPG